MPCLKFGELGANTKYSHLPDNKGVNYQVFLRALYNFAKVEMRLGR
jgi:dehydrodolichyl diphosphate syntase complex subunit NUS1